MLAPNDAALVAVSGGCDSMTLLDVLHRLSRSTRWRLTVAHFNHLLRGDASDADEHLVVRTSARLGIPVVTGRGEVKALARRKRLSMEMAARELRHEFLASSARDLGLRKLLVAHHADDQVETFFLRLMRGSGGEGLGGMKPVAPSPADPELTVLRPLLRTPRRVLVEYAQARQIAYREDASNASLDAQRNFVRGRLVPLLQQRFPALASVVARTMAVVADEADAVSQRAKEWLAGSHRAEFERLPIAVQRWTLALQLREHGVEAGFERLEALRQRPHRSVSITRGIQVTREPSGLVKVSGETPGAAATAAITCPNNHSGSRAAPGGTESSAFPPLQIDLLGPVHRIEFNGFRLRWGLNARPARYNWSRATRAVPQRERFDADAVGSPITLRYWQPGDRFQPIGLPRSVKLQDLFVNAKVPRAERRDRVLALTSRGEVFWVEGLRTSEPFKLTPDTKRVLEWRWNRGGARVAAKISPC